MQLENVGTGIVPYHIKVIAGLHDLAKVDVGTDQGLLLVNRTGQSVALISRIRYQSS